MRRFHLTLPVIACCAAVLIPALTPVRARAAVPTVASRKVWDAAPHNAFTDLVRFKDRWLCVFREGAGHVSPEGRLRVIESADGGTWKSAAVVSLDGADLRDAKVCLTPDGRLMLTGAAARDAGGGKKTHQSMAWFSADGRAWDGGTEIGDKDFWLWRVTWHDGTAYSIGYGTAHQDTVRLYSSRDGRRFDTLVPELFRGGEPNEHALVFGDDGTCLCLLRRDSGTKTAQLGHAKPPYKDWTWKDLGMQVGGPAMVRLPDGRLVAGVRLYDGKVRTSLCLVDAEKGTLTEWATFPSGGDTSYPGLVVHEGKLWVSYYSSHEGKTAIYLATVNPSTLRAAE
jgi:hypothetical protein